MTSPDTDGMVSQNNGSKLNMFDSIEIQPSRQNFGTITKRTRPTVVDLSMGNLKKHFETEKSSSFHKGNNVSTDNLDAMLDEQELNENDAAISDSKRKGKKSEKKEKKKFGTFDGVLARCLLCIWGVIMYLRTGWIVGNAGIWQTTIIMILASSVTFLTSLSLSAICTNGEVKSGGYYFLISRSLGPEFGGVIGILFAFANCISVAMYLAGFSETIVAQYSPPITGSERWDIVLWAEITLVLIFLLALRGVSGIIKFDMVLLVILVISIIVYFLGTFGITEPDPEGLGYTGYSAQTFSINWNADYMPGEGFISVFSVFFPAVTGEMAGANISGDLKNPSYSIPVGTLNAIVISTIVYIGIAWSLGGAVLRSVGDSTSKGLYYDFQIMPKISAFAPLVILGIFASTLSSGMSCFVGAPRIFQAVCQDQLFPQLNYFAKGRDKDGEPVRAYGIVFILCFLAILPGDINFIAPLITNFFLITYAVMNYSTFTWSLTRSPGWRPTFKWYNKWVSLFASAECIALMFLIDWLMALITVVIGVIMYKYVAYTEPNVHWGTAAEAITYVETCNKLLKYQTIKSHAKVERPKFLIFNRSSQHVKQMYDLASIMNEKFRGMTMIGDIIIGNPKDHAITNKYVKRARNHQWTDIPTDIIKNSLIQSCIAPNFVEGMRTILQTAGVGAIKPNVALFNMKDFTETTAIIPLKSPSKVRSVESPNSMRTVKSGPTSDDNGHKKDVVPYSENLDIQKLDDIYLHDSPQPHHHQFQPQAPDYIDGLQDALLTGMGVMLVAGHNYMDWKMKRNGFIDIWWLYDDGGLTVLIPYLLKSHSLWKDCKLRIMALENLGYSEQNELAALMTKLRIKAEIVAVRSEQSYDAFGGKISIDIGGNQIDKTNGSSSANSSVPSGKHDAVAAATATAAAAARGKSASPRSRSKGEYQKTPQDDIDADFPLVDDDEQKQKQNGMDVNDVDVDVNVEQAADHLGIDLNNTLIQGSKLMKSSFVDKHHKSLRHEVFTYDDIDDLNPDNHDQSNNNNHNHQNDAHVVHSIEEEKSDDTHSNNNSNRLSKGRHSNQYDMDDIINDNQISQYAKRKLKKYRKLGQLIERSRESDLCIVTMPFPRAEYTKYEYMKILQSLTPQNMNNLIFVRGNQDQVLTFAL